MATGEMLRVQSVWTGFSGAPGYTDHYFPVTDPPSAALTGARANVFAFWNAIKQFLPTVVTITVDTDVDQVNSADGSLTQILAGAGTLTVQGTSSGTRYAAPTGASVTWNTGAVYHGHRVVGRTFIVPVTTDNFAGDGTLDVDILTGIGSAAAALANPTDGPGLVVWSRPGTKGPGAFFDVVSARVPDQAAILRSRRD